MTGVILAREDILHIGRAKLGDQDITSLQYVDIGRVRTSLTNLTRKIMIFHVNANTVIFHLFRFKRNDQWWINAEILPSHHHCDNPPLPSNIKPLHS